MAQTSIFAENGKTVFVDPFLESEAGPFCTVKIIEEGLLYFVSAGEAAVRARAFAAGIVAACEAVEDADRRLRAVPIASLAPSEADHASV